MYIRDHCYYFVNIFNCIIVIKGSSVTSVTLLLIDNFLIVILTVKRKTNETYRAANAGGRSEVRAQSKASLAERREMPRTEPNQSKLELSEPDDRDD